MYTTCPVDGLNPSRDRFNSSTVKLPLRVTWKAEIYRYVGGIPLVSENHIYVHSMKPPKNSISEEKITAFNKESGKVTWERLFQDSYGVNSYCLSDDMIFFSTSNELLAIREGQVLWEFNGFMHSPIIVEKLLIFSALDGVYIFDKATGQLVKKIALDKPRAVSFHRGILIVGTPDNQLRGFELETGKEIWKTDLTLQAQVTDLVTKAVSAGQTYRWAPIIADQKVVLQTDRLTCCLDLNTGALLWERAYEYAQQITGWACGNRRLYCFNKKSLFCVDLATGEPIFTRQVFQQWADGAAPPFLTDNILFIASEGLHAYSTETGELLWEFWPKRRGMQNFSAMPVFVGGRLYASGKDGFLYCFEQES